MRVPSTPSSHLFPPLLPLFFKYSNHDAYRLASSYHLILCARLDFISSRSFSLSLSVSILFACCQNSQHSPHFVTLRRYSTCRLPVLFFLSTCALCLQLETESETTVSFDRCTRPHIVVVPSLPNNTRVHTFMIALAFHTE